MNDSKADSSPGTDCLIVINCGSSSLKLAVFPAGDETVLVKGLAERLGSREAVLTIERDGESHRVAIPSVTHHDALQAVVARMTGLNPRGIGHRVVHGGEEFTGSVVIDEKVMAAVDRCASLAPLHNPAHLLGMSTARELFPDLPQVAVFDTAFHQTLPRRAFLYAIPHEYYEKLKVRRYGFHGTSHHYVSSEAAEVLGKPAAATSLITMHPGNGCSACAIKGGRSVDSTMGLTPGEGLVMGSPRTVRWQARRRSSFPRISTPATPPTRRSSAARTSPASAPCSKACANRSTTSRAEPSWMTSSTRSPSPPSSPHATISRIL